MAHPFKLAGNLLLSLSLHFFFLDLSLFYGKSGESPLGFPPEQWQCMNTLLKRTCGLWMLWKVFLQIDMGIFGVFFKWTLTINLDDEVGVCFQITRGSLSQMWNYQQKKITRACLSLCNTLYTHSHTHTHRVAQAWHMQHWKWCHPSINPFWHMSMPVTLLPWQQFLQDNNVVAMLTQCDTTVRTLIVWCVAERWTTHFLLSFFPSFFHSPSLCLLQRSLLSFFNPDFHVFFKKNFCVCVSGDE